MEPHGLEGVVTHHVAIAQFVAANLPDLTLTIDVLNGVRQLWRRRSGGSATSHKASFRNFLGDGTIFLGDGTTCINSENETRKAFASLFRVFNERLTLPLSILW
jgi:hypothetical protein